MSILKRKLFVTYYLDKENSEDLPILIYCHTFSGNKQEGTFLIPHLLPHFIVCFFDFRGCGNSTEEYITLGIREKFDLIAILKAIEIKFGSKDIYLWGRSMGATAIIHLFDFLHQNEKKMNKKIKTLESEISMKVKQNNKNQSTKNENKNTNKFSFASNPSYIDEVNKIRQNHTLLKNWRNIRGVVLDSPFTDAHRLIHDVMTKSMGISKIVASMALVFVSRSINSHVKHDVLGDNKPIKLIGSLKTDALFIIGEKDIMVNVDKFKEMFDLCESEHKSLRYMQETGHADCRKEEDIHFAYNFLHQTHKKVKELKKEEKNQPLELKVEETKVLETTLPKKNDIKEEIPENKVEINKLKEDLPNELPEKSQTDSIENPPSEKNLINEEKTSKQSELDTQDIPKISINQEESQKETEAENKIEITENQI